MCTLLKVWIKRDGKKREKDKEWKRKKESVRRTVRNNQYKGYKEKQLVRNWYKYTKKERTTYKCNLNSARKREEEEK